MMSGDPSSFPQGGDEGSFWPFGAVCVCLVGASMCGAVILNKVDKSFTRRWKEAVRVPNQSDGYMELRFEGYCDNGIRVIHRNSRQERNSRSFGDQGFYGQKLIGGDFYFGCQAGFGIRIQNDGA